MSWRLGYSEEVTAFFGDEIWVVVTVAAGGMMPVIQDMHAAGLAPRPHGFGPQLVDAGNGMHGGGLHSVMEDGEGQEEQEEPQGRRGFAGFGGFGVDRAKGPLQFGSLASHQFGSLTGHQFGSGAHHHTMVGECILLSPNQYPFPFPHPIPFIFGCVVCAASAGCPVGICLILSVLSPVPTTTAAACGNSAVPVATRRGGAVLR